MTACHPKRIVQTLRKLGPYVLIEVLLPGGTLLALLLWLSQGLARTGLAGVYEPRLASFSVERSIGPIKPFHAWGHQQPLMA